MNHTSFTRRRRFSNTLIALVSLYGLVFIFSAFDPALRAVWIAEIIPVIVILLAILLLSRTLEFSSTAYFCMFIWLGLHTIGAKYTFAEVPFDWFNNLVGSERNHFDRVAHFSIGLYAYPIAEYLYRYNQCNKLIAALFSLFAIMSIAAAYEIIEWWYAELAGGDEGIAFLGSQGDIWDAQKDMLCDTLGALVALVIFTYRTTEKIK
ncbi:DUF2238 domain-containing protein [Vibrio sp. TH_r3]|uniref:DUF2238 domain-containing protein n=1 Tax=Vibrio sp. TH_r3 TaxID=3082084 RepID=UPI0029555191|nr:DUF2238 domain-containing protein [Vibrio sp. TH_r3]MDV7103531.1 DUF2238 domain-containing protein [Vibrio sp. TH_r3]